MYLLTKWEGRIGKYLARGHGVRTELARSVRHDQMALQKKRSQGRMRAVRICARRARKSRTALLKKRTALCVKTPRKCVPKLVI